MRRCEVGFGRKLGLRVSRKQAPVGESAMWGDYHFREAALYLQRVIRDEPYLTFWA